MKTSTNRILTTHVGGLIRPQALQEIMCLKQSGQPYDQVTYEKCLRESVAEIVRRQAEIGMRRRIRESHQLEPVCVERLTGFELRDIPNGIRPGVPGADRTHFKEFYAELHAREPIANSRLVACVGPVKYIGEQVVQHDIDNFKAALANVEVAEAFMPVVDAGFVLQINDARAANAYDRMVPPATFEEYRRWLAKFIESLNRALEGIPEDRVRYHICWGSWPGPHVRRRSSISCSRFAPAPMLSSQPIRATSMNGRSGKMSNCHPDVS